MAAVRVAVIGFGEVGECLTRGLVAGGTEVCVFSRPRDRLAERIAAAGAASLPSPAAVVAGADLVLIALPASCDAEVAAAAGALAEEAIAVDLSAADPEAKAQRARLATGYVDGAVLGTVTVDGFAVPIAASGGRAPEFARLGDQLGMSVTVVGGAAGQAARLKLLRSVYTKGRDALVLEMLLAARRMGLEAEVAASIGGAAEQVSFRDLADRLVTGVAVHSRRRADELAAAARLLERSGVEPTMARAGAELLERISALGLREVFDSGRPGDAGEVLAQIERLSGPRQDI